MNSEQFHARVEGMFKQSLQKRDSQPNALDLVVEVLKEAIDFSRQRFSGAPFHVKIGKFVDGVYTPNDEALIGVEILPLEDCEDWAGATFSLADVILAGAANEDEGWTVWHAVNQLERTIARLKSEAQKRGWEVKP